MKGKDMYNISKKCIIFFIALINLLACNIKKEDKKADPDSIYFDYKVTAEEGDDNLTILLQYRDGGEQGDAMSIGEPGKVMLDGEVLTPDSTRMTGTFYELHKPINGFSGKHSIIFTGIDKKEYREEFYFEPVSLLTPIADTIHRLDLIADPVIIGFSGLDREDYIRVVLTDTTYYNDGINRVDSVRNGQLTLTKADLEELADGPVQLEFIREYERPVKNGTGEGGRLLITYRLKRGFFLKE
ncbi:MAG: hypothetical protein H7Y01_09855 [Ferruginibacter sp.]|nr:hypothetical protein [Chitinophagaceae bacterium]